MLNSLIALIYGLYFFCYSFVSGHRRKLVSSLTELKNGLKNEGRETKEMFEIYRRYSKGMATEEEMERANDQFRDLLKGLGLGAILVLPFAPITLPIVVKLGRKLGVEIIPSSFRKKP